MTNADKCTPKQVGWRLAKLRWRAGYTQSQLADRVSETTTMLWEAGTVSRLERGLNGQSLRLIAAFCDACGADVVEVFT